MLDNSSIRIEQKGFRARNGMDRKCTGLTLVELLIVISLIAILAGVSIPLLRGRVNEAKWAEANTAAGTIRRAVRVYHSKAGSSPTGRLDDPTLIHTFEIEAADLTGSYFVPDDYEIVSVTSDGDAVIRVTGSLPNAPRGSKTMDAEGNWQ
jgi:prepilin-type N-terminal cleavage/methylation domain-containing protein